ncbi:MAG: hypothetical protein IPM89_11940 [Candidatus Competibacteraceae bacterium]|nr:MAG: hypothetical protein IPM89_11940 [Candidatus Competibacteraceae bacterium]
MTDRNSTAEPGMFDVELLLKQARAYLAFGEQIRQFAEQSPNASSQPTDWDTTLRQHFDRFKAAVAQSTEDSNIDPDLTRLWTLTLESWQQSAASLGVSAIAPRAGQSADTWQTYQQVQGEYFEVLRQSAMVALDLMEQRLRERAASGEVADSLRELFNLWVDCNEETYGRMLRSAEYSELSGRLLNALLGCCTRGEATS